MFVKGANLNYVYEYMFVKSAIADETTLSGMPEYGMMCGSRKNGL